MSTQKKLIGFFIIFLIAIFGSFCFVKAQDSSVKQETFKARIVEVSEEEKVREDGSKYLEQSLVLKGISGKWQNREFTAENIIDEDAINKYRYKKGNKVIVTSSKDALGNQTYSVLDYDRINILYFLAAIFAILVILVGRIRGVRALISLVASFLLIMYFIIPQILKGTDPLFVAIIGGVVILALIIYITEGFSRKTHIAMLSVTATLILIGVISIIFTYAAKLSGTTQEEVMYLANIYGNKINFSGLLLAGIVIGALGVLNDVVISQVWTVEEIKKAGNALSFRELFKRSLRVGVAHINSMTNTLFLAYAGASLPLLLLFTMNEPPFVGFSNVINNQLIATEIIRALIGSIGLVLAVPIATFLASKYLVIKK